jgi:beta-lactamase regulating signal transducer with metallopeptidase domain
MADIFNMLLQVTVTGALIFLAILVFKSIFRRQLSAKLHYLVWMLLMARLLLPLTFDSGVRLFVLPAQTASFAAEAAADPAVQAGDAKDFAWFAGPQASAQTEEAVKTAIPGGRAQAANTVPAPALRRQSGWQAAVVWVWICGMFLYFAYFAILYGRFAQIMRRDGNPSPQWLAETVEQYKKELHIRKNIRICVQESMISPALTLSFRPVLLLPQSMLSSLSREQAAMGIRHELAHYKYGDHVVCLILLLLRGVHWFNPFVWAAHRRIINDMETACDARVTSLMEKEQRNLYIRTMIDLASGARTHYALGMGVSCGKKDMERRIRGMFLRKKSARFAKASALLTALCLFLACFTTACYPAAASKSSGSPEQNTVSPAASAAAYAAPSHWKETAQDGKLIINIDTDVALPGQSAYPVIKLETAVFAQQRVDELVNYFAAGKKLYLPRETTKADYAKQIAEAKRGQRIGGKYVINDESLAWVKTLERKMASAPADTPKIYTDTTLTCRKDDESGKTDQKHGKNFLYAMAENEDGKDAYLGLHNFAGGIYNTTNFSYRRDNCYPETDLKLADSPERLKKLDTVDYAITVEAARAVADKAIADLDIRGLQMTSTCRALIGNAFGPQKGGYYFEYTRTLGGLTPYERRAYSVSLDEEPPAYAPPFTQENVTIGVSDEGIADFSWSGCVKTVGTVSESSALKPFDEIQQALIKHARYKYSFNLDGDNLKSRTVNILSAKLYAGYIDVKGNEKQVLLVPVWVFGTSETWAMKDKIETSDREELILNAIDGGVIGMDTHDEQD